MLSADPMTEVRRRKAALIRVETIVTNANPQDLEVLRHLLATCSSYEIALLREILLHDSDATEIHGEEQGDEIQPSSPNSAANGETLVKHVEDAIKRFDVITSTAILGYLKQRGVKFANQKPVAGVSAVLRKLEERGRLITVEKGSSHTPTVFRKAPRRGAKQA
jgi:hypothetical protein